MTLQRITVSILAGLVLAAPVGGQEEAADREPGARNAVYFELGGNALLYSLNYERRLRDGLAGRAGFMFIALQGTDRDTGESADVSLALIPVMINGLLGDGAGRLELGIGPVFGLAGGSVTDVEGSDIEFSGVGLAGVTSAIGYRYQPLDGGLVFRAGLVPFYSARPQLWAGLSLGYAF